MKKFKKFIFYMLILVLCFSPLLSACDFILPEFTFEFERRTIDSDFGEDPESSQTVETGDFDITLYPESRVLTWGKISGCLEYNVYINNAKVDSIKSSSTDPIIYDLDEVISIGGQYEVYVIAKGKSLFSTNLKSNVLSINYTPKAQVVPLNNSGEFEFAEENIPFNLRGTTLSYRPINKAGITNYKVYLYSYSNGLQKIDITTQSVDLLKTVNLNNEIYAVRFGYVIDGVDYVASDIKYLNPDNYAGFTDNIYLFDGKINDYYLKSLDELRNILYYSFIYRENNLNIKLSSELDALIENCYNANTMAQKLNKAIADACNYFFETRESYTYTTKLLSSQNRTYNISIDYEISQCNTSYVPDDKHKFPQAETEAFYTLCNYTMRKDDSQYALTPYDDFDSDKQIVCTEVATSEELFWAVENKVTPIVAKDSRAEQIYNIAKNTLNSIISDEMTEYEKALSIFDWVACNTQYDYGALEEDYYSSDYATIVPAYYLEGVFITGYAVCDGFSKAYSLLCNMEGIDAIRIVGTAGSGKNVGGHAWNKVLVDKNENDSIPAMYYIVDLTWTEFISGRKEETLSHRYFLVDDDNIKNSHYEFENREKYQLYIADQNYNYYNNTLYTYDGEHYDLVIDCEDDMEAMFYYMLNNRLKSFEIIVDYNYLEKGVGNIDNLFAKFKSHKFAEQYFFMSYRTELNSFGQTIILPEVYNDSGDIGLVFILLQNFRIDANGEVEHLVGYFDDNDLYGEYNIYIEDTMLNSVSGSTPLRKVNNLFNDVLSSSNLEITFEYVEYVSDEKESHFVMTVSEK